MSYTKKYKYVPGFFVFYKHDPLLDYHCHFHISILFNRRLLINFISFSQSFVLCFIVYLPECNTFIFF